MAVITKTIQPGEKSNEVTDMQKALISLGANIASTELFTATIAGTYGLTTQAAIAALSDIEDVVLAMEYDLTPDV